MRRIYLLVISILLLSLPALAAKDKIYSIHIDGIIDPAVAGYVNTSVEKAREDNVQCLVIGLDTPGGMLDATKEIVQDMLSSDVPVVVFVSPRGASATSAGMMITVGSHVAVMAEGTNIGAAHPVMMPFGVKYEPIDEEDTMMKKATEDTVGWVQSVAETRGRNAEWVEEAVRESSSITANQALEKGVIDGVVGDFDDLIEFLDGRVVDITGGDTITLSTGSAETIELSMSTPQKLQHVINNPNVILILLLLGALGIAIEFKAPGMIFPAVIGVGCILVALLAPSLPVNTIALMLILLGIVFLVAEVFITSYGLLSIAGVVAMAFGALMLFETEGVSGVRVDWFVLWPLVGFVVLVILLFGGAILSAHRAKVTSGREELVGLITKAETDIDPTGRIFIHGEYWNVRSQTRIEKGEQVQIEKVEDLVCHVKKVSQGAGPGGSA